MRSCLTVAALVCAAALSACGSGARQDAGAPSGRFPVQIRSAQFPASQTLSQHTHLTLSVTNTGHRTLPDVAVTICNVTCAYPAPKGEGSSAGAFAQASTQQNLANPSRPLWIIDRGPGSCGYSCQNGGQGAGVTAYTNTWALGPLRAGHTARFDWAVTAVTPGHHVIAWQVAAGLTGKARAVLANGAAPQGSFTVTVNAKPAQSYVNNNGQVVTTGSGQ